MIEVALYGKQYREMKIGFLVYRVFFNPFTYPF
jgi:hypothetical protein